MVESEYSEGEYRLDPHATVVDVFLAIEGEENMSGQCP